MQLQFITVFYSKTRFDRIEFYVDAELTKAHYGKPLDFYRQYSDHFPESIRADILEALDKQWDFVIDLQAQEIIQIKGNKDVMDIRPMLPAREAEKEVQSRHETLAGKISNMFRNSKT